MAEFFEKNFELCAQKLVKLDLLFYKSMIACALAESPAADRKAAEQKRIRLI